MSKVKEVVSKELLCEVFGENVLSFQILDDKDKPFNSAFAIVKLEDTVYFVSVDELVVRIVNKMITLGYVASLTKIKGHWWCEFATENYYKNNGIMSHGNTKSDYDIDTKSDDVLSCAVKAYGWISKNKGSK